LFNSPAGENMSDPFKKQVAGNHYKKYPIQPIEFCYKNNIPFIESSVIKYVVRHKDKNGADDILKAIHLLEMLLELEYANVEDYS
jgi:hypothetical protein